MSISIKTSGSFNLDPIKLLIEKIKEELKSSCKEYAKEVDKINFIKDEDSLNFDLANVSDQAKEAFKNALKKYSKN